jgi:hypothetical protein
MAGAYSFLVVAEKGRGGNLSRTAVLNYVLESHHGKYNC